MADLAKSAAAVGSVSNCVMGLIPAMRGQESNMIKIPEKFAGQFGLDKIVGLLNY